MRRLIPVAVVVAVLAAASIAAAQTAQRFSDVPPDHVAYEAVEWAAEVGLTLGYDDGTFRPDEPLPKWAALIFMERYYDDVLEAAEFDGFTRGDMMMLLKTIDDGGMQEQPPAGESETDARWLPRGDQGRIASGRCAHRVDDTDFYAWEDCAWGARPDPVMGRDEMEALADRVWTETNARGKPADPPALVEGRCQERRAAACYLPTTHTISIESGVTLRSILHELAHALITGDDTMADCYADWTHAISTCAHGTLFRCAADALYVRYGDIDAAGVCGSVPDLGDWARRSGDSVDGTYIEWRLAATVKVGRWTTQEVMVVLRCGGGRLTVWANGSHAYFGYGFGRGGIGVVAYRFGDQSGRSEIVVTEHENHDGDGDLWVMSSADASRFLNEMAADTSGRLYLQLIERNGLRDGERTGEDEVEAEATLRTDGYGAHIHPRIESCG